VRGVLAQAQALRADLAAASEAAVTRRRPAVCAAMSAAKPQKLFNPRYEVDFDKGRDYDPDRERAEERRERRAVHKEMRGAGRGGMGKGGAAAGHAGADGAVPLRRRAARGGARRGVHGRG